MFSEDWLMKWDININFKKFGIARLTYKNMREPTRLNVHDLTQQNNPEMQSGPWKLYQWHTGPQRDEQIDNKCSE